MTDLLNAYFASVLQNNEDTEPVPSIKQVFQLQDKSVIIHRRAACRSGHLAVHLFICQSIEFNR